MASNPPSTCCTVGVKHEGETTGKTERIGNNIEIYIAEPTGKNVKEGKAILYVPDVIGIWQNSQLMADQFAANGYYTIILDLFNGDPVSLNRPEGFDFVEWMTRGSDGKNPHTVEYIDKITAAGIEFLKSKGYNRVGALGYCFGAKYVARFMAGKGIDVGYCAHPSFVSEDEVRAIRGPFSISAAETDVIFPKENRIKTEEILKETGNPYQINLFSGVEHGYSVRADLDDKWAKWTKEQAFLQAVAWMDYFL